MRHLAQEKFGYDLRPGQEAAVQSIVAGQDTLAIMPTGWGKSLIYQLAAQVLSGPTVIVSPLIALQRDQVESIEEMDAGHAALLNSTLRASEWREAMEDLKNGNVDFVFLAPEQFNNEETLGYLLDAHPSLFVVDEAHCISEWGHDFRPDYLRLGAVIESLGHPPVLALTATAAPPVREEIIERLAMRNPRVISQGFDRPNIWLGVEMFHDESTKKAALLERVVEAEKPGIVYVATRKHAEDIAEALRERGVKAVYYHAGMKSKDRAQVQEDFMADVEEVIVATTAFGMGVDKPNVRFVYHYDISDSVDSYYQEIGRAGRDGEASEAILFYNAKDLALRRFFASGGLVDADQVEHVAEAVLLHKEPVEPNVLRQELDLSQSRLLQALNCLEEMGVVEMLPTGEVQPGNHPLDVEEVTEVASLQREHQRQFEQSRLEMMRGYAELTDCRREYLLNYFGEQFDAPCEFCDNCDAGLSIPDDEENVPFPINARVTHKEWGEGMVLRYEGDKMVVLFDDVGYKTLAVDIVVENHLLEAVSVEAHGGPGNHKGLPLL